MARKTTATSSPVDTEFVSGVGANAFQIATNAFQAWAQGVGTYNSEATRFLGRRLASDLDVASKLSRCKTPADVVEIQSSFTQGMISDYADEAQRMSALATGVFENETWWS